MPEQQISFVVHVPFADTPWAEVLRDGVSESLSPEQVQTRLSEIWDGGPYDHLRGERQREISLFLKLRDLLQKGKRARGESLQVPSRPGVFVTTTELL